MILSQMTFSQVNIYPFMPIRDIECTFLRLSPVRSTGYYELVNSYGKSTKITKKCLEKQQKILVVFCGLSKYIHNTNQLENDKIYSESGFFRGIKIIFKNNFLRKIH